MLIDVLLTGSGCAAMASIHNTGLITTLAGSGNKNTLNNDILYRNAYCRALAMLVLFI